MPLSARKGTLPWWQSRLTMSAVWFRMLMREEARGEGSMGEMKGGGRGEDGKKVGGRAGWRGGHCINTLDEWQRVSRTDDERDSLSIIAFPTVLRIA